MPFDYSTYNTSMVTCQLCNTIQARGNVGHHKGTKKHKNNVKMLMDTLTVDERIKIKNIITLMNREDLLKIL